MKKFLLILGLLIFGLGANALTLQGEAQFDWVDIDQVQRDERIELYRAELFGENGLDVYSKKEFKQKFKEFKKDENVKRNYHLAKMDVKETEDANICAFLFKKDILLSYALQYKNNLRNVYYYNAYGRLAFVDDISEQYPNFPYTSKQYRANGKLVSAIYFVSPEMQYMYNPDGSFKGLWYKEKMYDKNGKQKVVRTNWGI